MVNVADRDPITQRVAINLAAMIAERKWTNADLRAKVGQAASTAIYDFLSPHPRSRSLKVETLAKFADALGKPIVLFFVEPDKLAAFEALLDTLGKLDESQVATIQAVAQTLSATTKK